MKLLPFQQRAVQQVIAYLEKTSELSRQLQRVGEFNVPALAWEQMGLPANRAYSTLRDASNTSIPCVCVVIPTGGGKTVTAMACGIAATRMRALDHNLLVWVVPSDAIYEQTWRYLARGYLHEYAGTSGLRVHAKRIGDAWSDLDFSPSVLTVLLVTQQSIFGSRPDLHFARPSEGLRSLSLWSHAREEPSLSSLLDLLQPVFIVDESHRVYTDTGRAFFRGRKSTSCVIEFSATPRDYSPAEYPNVVVATPASELIAEQLIKNPLVCLLEPSMTPSDLLGRVTTDRQSLAAALAEEGYLTAPKVLVSCRRTSLKHANDPLSAHSVRKVLLELGIAPDAIAIKSAELDQLQDADIDSPNCGIHFVLTQRALVEGWDAKSVFMVVLINDIGAPLTSFQIVGRGLRQPHRRYFAHPELNRLRVYSNGLRQEAALSQLRDFLAGEGLASGLALTVEGHKANLTSVSYDAVSVQVPGLQLPMSPEAMSAQVCLLMGRQPPPHLSAEEVLASASIGGSSVIQLNLNDNAQVPFAFATSTSEHSLTQLWQRRFVSNAAKQIAAHFPQHTHCLTWIDAQLQHLLIGPYPSQLAEVGPIRVARAIADHVATHERRLYHETVLRQLADCDVCDFQIDGNVLGGSAVQADPPGTLPFSNNLLGDVPKSMFNAAELEFAREIDGLGHPWIRNLAGAGWYSLPGGPTGRFYPDFIVLLDEKQPHVFGRVVLLETKGAHLVHSHDSRMKREVCDEVTAQFPSVIEAHFGAFSELRAVLHGLK